MNIRTTFHNSTIKNLLRHYAKQALSVFGKLQISWRFVSSSAARGAGRWGRRMALNITRNSIPHILIFIVCLRPPTQLWMLTLIPPSDSKHGDKLFWHLNTAGRRNTDVHWECSRKVNGVKLIHPSIQLSIQPCISCDSGICLQEGDSEVPKCVWCGWRRWTIPTTTTSPGWTSSLTWWWGMTHARITPDNQMYFCSHQFGQFCYFAYGCFWIVPKQTKIIFANII